MLIEFIVENYLSYRDETIFSMETGANLRKYSHTNTLRINSATKVVKNAVIFGANGSGKSNLLFAIATMRRMILSPTASITEELEYSPFLLDETKKNQPTKFGVRIALENQIWDYEFEYNEDEIISEKLVNITTKGKEKVYFNRNKQDFEGKNSLKKMFKQTRKNKLFLVDAQNRNDPVCIKIFEWFDEKLIIFTGEIDNEYYAKLKDDDTKRIFLDLMKLTDFNIIDVEVEEDIEPIDERVFRALTILTDGEDADIEKFKNRKTTKLYLVYKKYDSEGRVVGKGRIPYSMESSGTRRLINIFLMVIISFNESVTILMDEFDDSFHLNIAQAVIKLINTPENKNQFIFTTHNLNLLDCGLRVDQIYFVEKTFYSRSDLYSLFDFDEITGTSRSDISFASRYLKGQFGAVPFIDINSIYELLGEING